MGTLGRKLLEYMFKWSGKSGGLILVNELKKLSITDVERMSLSEKEKLLDHITNDCLSTFLGHSRFLVARSELVSILGISQESYMIKDSHYSKPRSPNLFGKP